MFSNIQKLKRGEPSIEIPKEYNLAGQSWEKEEDDQLVEEYNIGKLDLMEICKVHKRMPGGIMSRLKRLNLINMKNEVRGYSEYLKSDLYKIVSKITNERKNTPLTQGKQTLIQDSMVFKKPETPDAYHETLKELLVVAKDIQRMMKDFHADNFVERPKSNQ